MRLSLESATMPEGIWNSPVLNICIAGRRAICQSGAPKKNAQRGIRGGIIRRAKWSVPWVKAINNAKLEELYLESHDIIFLYIQEASKLLCVILIVSESYNTLIKKNHN